MTEFITSNIGTVAVASTLCLVLIRIIVKLRKDKKEGKGCCGNCSGCGCECAARTDGSTSRQ